MAIQSPTFLRPELNPPFGFAEAVEPIVRFKERITPSPQSPPIDPERMFFLASRTSDPISLPEQYRASVKCMNKILKEVFPKDMETARRLYAQALEDKVLLPQHEQKIILVTGWAG